MLRFPVLGYQQVLTEWRGECGWLCDGHWTPAKLLSTLIANDKLVRRFDALRYEHREVIYACGLPEPTLSVIPRRLRASRDEDYEIRASGIPNAGQGLFATRALSEGTSWLMGGTVKIAEPTQQMSIGWSKMGLSIEADVDAHDGWKANEPTIGFEANAVYLNSVDGVFLVLTQLVKKGEEIFVHYGDAYAAVEDPYDRSVLVKPAQSAIDAAVKALQPHVYGIELERACV